MNSVYYLEVWNIWIDCIFTHLMFGTWFSSTLWECILTKDVCVCVSLNCVQLFATPRTIAHQAPLSMGIFQARILEWVAIPFFRTKDLLSLFLFFFFSAPPQDRWNFLAQGLNQHPWQWKCRVLTTGPAGTSRVYCQSRTRWALMERWIWQGSCTKEPAN